jgi:hypothetical protein
MFRSQLLRSQTIFRGEFYGYDHPIVGDAQRVQIPTGQFANSDVASFGHNAKNRTATVEGFIGKRPRRKVAMGHGQTSRTDDSGLRKLSLGGRWGLLLQALFGL